MMRFAAHQPLLVFLTCALQVLLLLQFLLGSVSQATVQDDLQARRLSATRRAYGDIPPQWYSEEANAITNDGPAVSHKPMCGDVIHLRTGQSYNFTVDLVTKLCSVVIKTGPKSTLKIPRVELSLRPCREEHFYYIADNFQRKLVVCGDAVPVQLAYASKLLLQYERRAPTRTTFTLTVTAHAVKDSREGRVIQDTQPTTLVESAQICPEACGRGFDTDLTFPRSVFERTQASPGQFPFLASIFVSRKSASEPEHCGGSILDKRHVLTAANCFRDEDDIVEVYVAPGARAEAPRSGEFTPKHSIKCVEPLGYHVTKKGWRINDIALVVLGFDLTFGPNVSPVCLAGPGKMTTRTLAVPGYNYPAVNAVTAGLDKSLPVSSEQLEVAKVVVWENNECERLFHRNLTDKQLCVYDYLNGTCTGQPGAPAVLRLDGRYYQVAVASHGFPCQSDPLNLYGVYTSVAPFMSEIQDRIGPLDNC